MKEIVLLGAFAAKHINNNLLETLEFANAAAAISNTKVGVQSAILSEKINNTIGRNKNEKNIISR